MSYPGIVNSPEYQAKVAGAIAACHTQPSISEALNISQPTVSRIANLDVTRQLIETARKQIIESTLPKAVQNVQQCVDSATTDHRDTDGNESPHLKDMRYWGLRYSEKLMESIGVMGSNTPSTVVQAVFNSTTTVLSPVVEQLLVQIGRPADLPSLEINLDVDK